MMLYFQVTSDNEYYQPITCALVELTPDIASKLLVYMDTARDLHQEDNRFVRMEYFLHIADWYEGYDEALIETLEAGDEVAPERFEESSVKPARTELNIAQVRPNSVTLQCVLKHISHKHFLTQPLTRSFLTGYLEDQPALIS